MKIASMMHLTSDITPAGHFSAEVAHHGEPQPFHDEAHPSRADLAALLQDHGIQPTQPRLEIAYVLFRCQQHLSADQIFTAVNLLHDNAAKATIYNTLNLFVEKKLMRELIIDRSKIYYDRNTEPHHHFYNVETGALTDIPAQDIHIKHLPILPAGCIMDDIEVIVKIRRARK